MRITLMTMLGTISKLKRYAVFIVCLVTSDCLQSSGALATVSYFNVPYNKCYYNTRESVVSVFLDENYLGSE
jgi:hypothetical protein